MDQKRSRRFFEPLAPLLRSFARKRNLELREYQKEDSVWSFLFRHPKGGTGQIDVMLDLTVASIWSIPEYETGGVSIKGSVIKVQNPKMISETLLEGKLHEILCWEMSQLDRIDKDETMRQIWHERWTPEQFSKLESKLPFPSVNDDNEGWRASN